MGKWINADYIKAVMKGDRLMQGNCEYELWKQEVDKKVDAMPGIEVMDVVTAYQQGWCDALDASISALNDAKFQLGKVADRKTEPQTEVEMMSCAECKHRPIGAEICEEACHYEPQTDWHYDEQDATWYPYKHEDEPQTEVRYSDSTDYQGAVDYVTDTDCSWK